MKLLSTFFLLFSLSLVQAGEIPIYILAGQSNAMGAAVWDNIAGLPEEADLRFIEAKRLIYRHNQSHSWLEPYQLGVNTLGNWKTGKIDWPGFGSESGFMLDLLHLEHPNQAFVLFKYGLSGTSLVEDWFNGKELKRLFLFHMEELKNLISDQYENDTPVFKAMFWMQGESDNGKQKSKNYDFYLKQLIIEARQKAGNDFPVFLGKIRSKPNRILKRQRKVMRDLPNVAMVGTRWLDLLDDGIHFDARGLIDLGHLFYDAYKSWNQHPNIETPKVVQLKLLAYPNPLARDQVLNLKLNSNTSCTSGKFFFTTPDGKTTESPLIKLGVNQGVFEFNGVFTGETELQLPPLNRPDTSQILFISFFLTDCASSGPLESRVLTQKVLLVP